PVGPVAEPFPCSGCGRLLDPLRAGHVAIFDQQLHYFCDRTTCRPRFLETARRAARPTPSPPRPAVRAAAAAAARDAMAAPTAGQPSPSQRSEAAPIRHALAPATGDDQLTDLPLLGDDPATIEPLGQTVLHESPQLVGEAPETREGSALLL